MDKALWKCFKKPQKELLKPSISHIKNQTKTTKSLQKTPKSFPCCSLSFLYHLLMPDNHFLQGGPFSLAVCSLITFLCLLFSVLLYTSLLFHFITSVFHCFSPWASQLMLLLFTTICIINTRHSFLFLLSHQAARVVNLNKSDQCQMLQLQN